MRLSRLFASQKVVATFKSSSRTPNSVFNWQGPASTLGAGDVGWTDEHSQDLCYGGQVPQNEGNVPVPKS